MLVIPERNCDEGRYRESAQLPRVPQAAMNHLRAKNQFSPEGLVLACLPHIEGGMAMIFRG